MENRYHGSKLWGPGSKRHITTSTWGNPAKWNKQAAALGLRYKVFASSLSDFFEDNDQITETRIKAWKIIKDTPHLDWLILTKRPENITKFVPEDWESGYDNVWLGTSIGSQKDVAMISDLLLSKALVKFLSCEPLLGPLDLSPYLSGIDWVIVGGESGMKQNARPFNIEWAKQIQRDCDHIGVSFFMKQLGSNPVYPSSKTGNIEKLALKPYDRKGDDFEMFPEDLKVRQFPILF